MEREPLHSRRVPLAEDGERALVSCLRPRHQDGVGEPLVDERCVEMLTAGWTARGRRRLHGGQTLVPMALVPETVLPRLRGTFGRPYLHAAEAPTTMKMPGPDAS